MLLSSVGCSAAHTPQPSTTLSCTCFTESTFFRYQHRLSLTHWEVGSNGPSVQPYHTAHTGDAHGFARNGAEGPVQP